MERENIANILLKLAVFIILFQASVRGTNIAFDSTLSLTVCPEFTEEIPVLLFDLDAADPVVLEAAKKWYESLLMLSYTRPVNIKMVHIKGSLPSFFAEHFVGTVLPCETVQLEGRNAHGVEVGIFNGPNFYEYFRFSKISLIKVKKEDLHHMIWDLLDLMEEQAIILKAAIVDSTDSDYLDAAESLWMGPSAEELTLVTPVLPDEIGDRLLEKTTFSFYVLNFVGDAIENNFFTFSLNETMFTLQYNSILSRNALDWYKKASKKGNLMCMEIICRTQAIDDIFYYTILYNQGWTCAIYANFQKIVCFRSFDDFTAHVNDIRYSGDIVGNNLSNSNIPIRQMRLDSQERIGGQPRGQSLNRRNRNRRTTGSNSRGRQSRRSHSRGNSGSGGTSNSTTDRV